MLEYWGTPAAQNHPGLDLRQYLIPYDYNSYNSFLGIYTVDSAALPCVRRVEPARVCLHGKVKHLYTAHVLQALSSLPSQVGAVPFELHATISGVDVVGEREHKPIAGPASFERIHNYGVQGSREAWSDFLSACSVMLGVGQPYAAPTVLDAIAHGAVYVDYVYAQPIRFTGINPDITLHSQHSIAAQSFDRQYLIPVNWSSGTMLADTVRSVLLEQRRIPYVHPKYTLEAIAERLFGIIFNSL